MLWRRIMANDLGKCDVVTWGEGFLRLTPKEKERFEQSAGFNVAIAGGALETAVGLSRLGYRASWFSAVGDTPLGAKIVNKVREHGVDTTCVELVPDGRTGLCYTEIGTAPRLTKSWFDMHDTAFRKTSPASMGWSSKNQTKIFHVDITPPLIDSVDTNWLKSSLINAKTAVCQVSVLLDLPSEEGLDDEIRNWIFDLVDIVDIFQVTLRTLKTIWDYDSSLLSVPDFVQSEFKRKTTVVMEQLFSGTGSNWKGTAVSPDGEVFESSSSGIVVIDPYGALGAFAAGFLYGYLSNCTYSGLQYGTAAAGLACSVPGSLNWVTKQDLDLQIEGTGSGLER